MHIDNLDYILSINKLTTCNHSQSDQNYKPIGESDLISKRENHKIITNNSSTEYCPACEFIPFHFGKRSVMLYRVKNRLGSTQSTTRKYHLLRL